MQTPGGKIIEFRCGLNGVFSKESPDLLKDGQYRSANNVASLQEGSVSSRTGIKLVGYLTTNEPTCYFIRKLVVEAGEDPLNPATNPRYLGILTNGGARNIYRTTDYSSKTLVATAVDTTLGRHWEMADYSAGSSGTPWAYFACPNAMLKDRGTAPYATLAKWGIQAACGVALAAVVKGSVNITAIDSASGVAAVTLALDVGLSDYDQVTFAGTPDVTFTTSDGRSNPVTEGPWDIRIGIPDAAGVTTKASTMFRLYDRNGQGVGITGTYAGTGASLTGVPVKGNLDGGALSSRNQTQPYGWATVYEETDTGDKGNPSQLMSELNAATLTDAGIAYSGKPLAIHNGTVKVVVWGTADARIGFIRVYRRGGLLTDMVGRLVARVSNPGAEAYAIITDEMADADLQFMEQWETDNDPPVPSTVPSPIRSSVSGAVGSGWQTANLAGNVFGPVTPGSLVHVIDPINSEDVYASAVTSTSFRAYFQFAHASGVPIEVDSIRGQACNLVATVGEATLVAGDPNNPHVLYKSKTGAPQAFPIGTDAAGAITSIGVGSPSNGIVNVTECRGQAVCLNVNGLYEVAILNGSLTQPVKVAGKGLRGQSAWCKDYTEAIWYLSDDGVYSWDGAFARKRSEAIDPIFHSQQFNGIPPLDMSAASLAGARMEFRRGLVHLVYKDITGHVVELVCEPMYGDRWIPMDGGTASSSTFPITMLYREPDTQSLIVATYNPASGVAVFGISDATVPSNGTNFTSDWWTTSASGGNFIPWDLRLPWFDMGNPAMLKLFEEIWLDVDPQLYRGVYITDSSMTVELLLNYSDTVVETFTVAIPSGTSLTGRQLISLLPNLTNTSGAIYQSYGREARAISFHLFGHAHPSPFSLFRILIQSQETGLLTAGAAADWMDFGSKHDKRLYQMAVVFDSAGTNRQIVLEPRGGREGKTAGVAQVFTLSSPTDLGSGRCLKIFPLADPTVLKLARVRPYAAAAIAGGPQSSVDLFRVLEVTFPDSEEYPPDIVSRAGGVANGKVTEAWTTGGYDYDKYANQIAFEVNTNSVAVTVQLQADGANAGAAFTITTTDTDRKRNITLPSGLRGKSWSVFVDPAQTALTSGSGMWQLFNLSWKFQQADKGEVVHSGDWDSLAHPYDKYLTTLTVEWDDTGGADVTLQLDTISGIGGQTLNPDIMFATPIVLSGGRGKKTFPLPPDTIAKLIRLYPKGNTIPIGFKQWKYEFDKIPYPADIITTTPWMDAQTPNDKNPSWLWIDADTAGVAASVVLQRESATAMTVNHTGTVTNRKANFPIPVDTIGKMWRLKPTIGFNGKFQCFTWGFARWHPFPQDGSEDPPEVVLWTPWTDCGYPFGKLARSLILTLDTGGIPCSVALQTQEGGTVQTFSVNTTYATRRVVLTCDANLIGTQWRLLLAPGLKAKLWDWNLDVVKLPPALTRWSSSGQGFGYRGWKFCAQFWLDYVCAGAINVTFYSDTGIYTMSLPAGGSGVSRVVARRPFPDKWGSGLNKSTLYGIDIAAAEVTKPFMAFGDCSGIEWIPCGGDRHASWQTAVLSEFMQIQV